MVQRIQTIYLLIAFLIIESLFFLPLGEIIVETINYKLNYKGFIEITDGTEKLVQSTFTILIFLPIIGILNLITIFLFKNRTLQYRITLYNALLMIGLSITIAFILYRAFPEPNAIILPKISIILPIIAAILNILAFKQIRKDETLVKSVDRLR